MNQIKRKFFYCLQPCVVWRSAQYFLNSFGGLFKSNHSLSHLGYRNFFTIDKIIDKLQKSEYLYNDETIKEKNGFVFFTNKKQHLWIIISNKHLFIILDDITSDNIILKLRHNLEILTEKINLIQLMPDEINIHHGKIKFPDIDEKFWCSLGLFQTNEDIIRYINLFINRK